MVVERLGVDLGDDERDLGVAAERATSCRPRPRRRRRTSAPTRADVVAPALKSAMSKPWIVSSASARMVTPSSSLARGALGGERDDLARPGSRARAAWRASRCRRRRWRRRRRRGTGSCGCSERVLGLDLVGAELERLVQRADGAVDRSALTTHEILIGDVEIISMLMPWSPSVAKTRAATPGCDFIPAPTTETLPISGSSRTSRMPTSADDRVERGARGAQVRARDGEGHVAPRRPRTRARSG